MDELAKAIEILRGGGIVIYPTDTAFGIGCRIDNEKAVSRLFEIRKRPQSMATPVLFDSIERVKEYVLPFNSGIEGLMKNHWPGPLTIVLSCQAAKINPLIRGNGETLGVRIPDHQVPIKLIEGLGIPIIGTSANFHGQRTPYTFEALDKRLIKLVDLCLEGKTKGGSLSSTVVDCGANPWKIIRQGSISI